MRKVQLFQIITCLLAVIMTMLLYIGCAFESPKIIANDSTSAGTPIVDREASDFSISDAMMRNTPNSTCFSKIGYNEDKEILVVTFRSSGYTYLYFGVSKSEWTAFRTSDSLGKYYNSHIKGHYECFKY